MTIVNQTVGLALETLGYSADEIDAIKAHLMEVGSIVGAPGLKDEHLPVFDVAVGERAISAMGHVKMMAAAQPFISGAISKTVNLPESATVEEISEAYIQAWKLGLKAVAVYRDGCKKSQPLSAAGTKTAEAAGSRSTGGSPVVVEEQDPTAPPKAVRHKLLEERMSITHKFNVGGHEGYITVGLYPSGSPGEIFITMAKEGSTVSGLMDSFSCAISLALQHGVPLKMLCEKFAHTRFEPSGWTNNPDIGFAKSIMDYIFRWLQLRFLTGQQQLLFENLRPRLASGQLPEAGDLGRDRSPSPGEGGSGSLATSHQPLATGKIHAADALSELVDLGDAPSCHVCGSIMVRNGSCYKCMSCGSTSGCS
jgi:ribonucleoside-diphosphate reductase alpha chain